MRVSLALIALLALLAGCATTGTVEQIKESEGQGVSRIYGYPADAVYVAVLAAAHARNLDIVEADNARRRVILSHGTTLLSWGEKIAVFVRQRSANSTSVEVVSKPVMSTLNFPPDWPTILFDEIDTQLRTRE